MKIAYICGVVAFIAFLTYTKAEFIEELKAVADACLPEAHTTKEDLERFFKNGMKEADATEGIKCHAKCMMEKQGHFKNGQFDDQAFIQKIQSVPALKDRQAEIVKAAAECKEEKGANDCDTAFKIAMCFKDKKAGL